MRTALAAFDLRLRPARGQHFLTSRRILDRILDASALTPDDVVLEVGAGIGTLTVALARTGAQVITVEVDARFIPLLRAVCAPYPRVRILHADAMGLTPGMLPAVPTKVVANLPYSIASPLLVRLLEARLGRRLVVMVQEEVARRLAARPDSKTYGLLSVMVQAYATPQIVALVPRTAFYPAPQVRSAIVRLDARDRFPLPEDRLPALVEVARAAFGQRRKMLRSALQRVAGRPRPAETVEALCRKAGIDPRRRGESLSLEEFARLTVAFGSRE
ncbi:MAG: 16S rRNA (adenine(1518)-N(6)/adenine(1519)-N(6))-dimethyltransferase RsmA [Armatimonadetes bacterium]|nr:16S rRNA (adenine(1518)-N(6)/adenine(1519)-N(6))-dimethyltransferase RsmA [Armatimonadota bacterium]